MRTFTRRPWTTCLAAIAASVLAFGAVVAIDPPAAHADTTVSGVVNSYQDVSVVSGSSVTVTGPVTGEGTAFAVGDTVMLIQMTGAPPAQGSDFGNYDVATITAISGSAITLSGIAHTYSPATEAVQLVRFPTVDAGVTTVSGTVTALPWDGVTGGVVAISGVTLSLGANIDATGTGFTNAHPPTAGPGLAPLSSGPGSTPIVPTPPAGDPQFVGQGYADETARAEGGGGTGGGGGENNTGNSTGGSLGNGGMGNGSSGYVIAPGTDGGPACQSGFFYGALGAAGGGGGITGGGGGGGGFDGINFSMPGGSAGGGGGVAGGGAGGSGLTLGCSNFEMSGVTGRAGSGGGVGAPGNGGDGLIGGDSGQAPPNCDPETNPEPCSQNEGSAGAGGGSYGGGGGAASNYSGGDDSSGGGGGGSWTGGGLAGAGGDSSGFAGGDGNDAVGTQIPDTEQYLNATYPRLMMGGAGGLGSSEGDVADDPNTAADETKRPVVGGAGGGIVYVDFWTITGDGQIRSDGADGGSPVDFGGGAHSGAGAGAGGQMHILARTITSANLVLAVVGGEGGTPSANNYHAGVSGGGGGAGGIWLELAGADQSCPAGDVDNVTFEIAGGAAGPSIINPKDGGSDTGTAGDGAMGLACVSRLAAPVITVAKDVTSTTANADGTYTIVYDVVVTNSGDADGTYDLSDTLRPGAGAVFVSGTWTGPATPAPAVAGGAMNAPNTATPFVTGRPLAASASETYTVTATYTINNAAISNTTTSHSADCTQDYAESNANTGFNNVASLTTDGTTTTDSACAPFGVITFVKDVLSSTLNTDGSYDVVYAITVTNTSGVSGAAAAYDLSDTLRPGAGAVFESGSWVGPGSALPTIIGGANTPFVLATDRLLTNVAPNNVEVYTVSTHYTIDPAAVVSTDPNDSTDCAVTAGEPNGNTGFNNVASLTTGGQTITDTGCSEFEVPKIEIVKGDTDGNAADTPADAAQLPDGTADLVFTVTNNGTEDLEDVEVTDVVVTNGAVSGLSCVFPDGSVGTTWVGPFAVDATFDCTASLTGVLTGSVHEDVATVTGTGVVSGTDVSDDNPYHAETPEPDIEIVKGDAQGNTADTADDLVELADGTASLVFTITNNGTEVLEDIEVTDAVVTNGAVENLSCVFPDGSTGTTWAGPFAVDATFDCTADLTGVLPGSVHEDVATVTGTGVVTGTPVDDDNPYFAETPEPEITIVKGDADGNTADTAAEAVELADGTADLVFTITNSGTEALENVEVTDVVVTNGAVSGLSCVFPDGSVGTTWVGPFAIDATFDCTASLTGVVPGNPIHEDVATVTGTGVITGTDVSDDNPYHATTPEPGVEIVKGDDAGNTGDAATDPVQLADGTASLVFTITNNGTEALEDIEVSDAVVSNGTVENLTCVFPDGSTGTSWVGPFAIDATFDCTADLTGVLPGSVHEDVATVTGTGVVTGTPVDDDNPYFADTPEPEITIVKGDSDGNTADTAAEAVELADGTADLVFTITNSGTEDLEDIEVSDAVVSNGTVENLTCVFPDGSTGTAWAGPFLVDDTFDCTADLSGVVPGDPIHEDVATVTGVGVVTGTPVDDDNPYHATTPEPGVVIVKGDDAGNAADSPEGAAQLGDGTASLVFTITNNGTEALEDIEVSDAVVSNGTVENLTCVFPDGSTGTAWAGPFLVDDTFDCTADLSGVVPGSVHEDVATVTGVGVVTGNPVDDDNPYHAVTPEPEITIVKGDTDGNTADTADEAVELADGTASLVFTITNPGTEALEDIEVTDTVVTNGTVENLTCVFPDGSEGTSWVGPFAVDATFDCTADLTGVLPGSVHEDAATVTGTGVVTGTPVDDDNPYHAVTPEPEITIVKGDSDGNTADTAAEAVELPDGTGSLVFTITNTGTEALENVEVTDVVVTNGTVENLTCVFPDGSEGTTWVGPLAINATFDCSADLVGVVAGSVHEDIATVTGTGVVTGAIVNDDNPYHATTPEPGVEIVKGDTDGNAADTADEAVELADGTASLVFTVTNTGTEALEDVEVSDVVVSNGTVENLTCVFPDGSEGTTWAGPFAIDATFDCTADLTGVLPGSVHEDVATVTGTGVVTGNPVTDDNPYFGKPPVTPETPSPSPDPSESPSSPSPSPSESPSSPSPSPSEPESPEPESPEASPTPSIDTEVGGEYEGAPLPSTGSNAATMIVWMVIIVGAGAGLLAWARRRRSVQQ